MTGRTHIIMSVNLRRHSSCQFHGVRTGNGMRRDLFPPRLEWRFVSLFAAVDVCFLRSLRRFYRGPRASTSPQRWRNGQRISQEADKMLRWTTVACLVVFKFQIASGRGRWKDTFFFLHVRGLITKNKYRNNQTLRYVLFRSPCDIIVAARERET